MFYGFTEFCQYFLERFPGGYYLWPLRLNGSALETVFSQLKFNMNGQLSSVNYPAALTTLKLKRRIHGRRGKFLYRKTPLYVREISLKRKPRVNWGTVVMTVKNCGHLQVFSLYFFKLCPLINYYKALDQWCQWKQWAWFPQDPKVKQTGTLRIDENINSLFPMRPVI